jgi:hypothetical protein
LNRPEPDWNLTCDLPDDLRHRLAVSLSHFQLGETGGGHFLLKEAAGNCDADDLVALDLFIKEEAEHARLLAQMEKRLGGRLVRRHWTHRLFKLARRAGGFHFEIQMLLTAEIVGTAYYRMIVGGVPDVPINAAIRLMLRDEAAHVAFHLDRSSFAGVAGSRLSALRGSCNSRFLSSPLCGRPGWITAAACGGSDLPGTTFSEAHARSPSRSWTIFGRPAAPGVLATWQPRYERGGEVWTDLFRHGV